ncbi:MAG: hypothetical protein IPJ01_12005 [Micavibrio sp.]|nr:hypothetical protein [Micavibrio sp.]
MAGERLSAVVWSKEVGLFVAVGSPSISDTARIYTSPDGITWTLRAQPFGAGNAYVNVTWCAPLSLFVAVGGVTSGNMATSPDGITWTTRATGFGVAPVYGVAYSPLLSRFVIVGFNGKLSTSAAFTASINASIAGFNVTAAGYGATLTAYNCTLNTLGAAFSVGLQSCRVRVESQIVSNSQVSFGNLFDADRYVNASPATQNAVDIACDTMAGRLYIQNTAATGRERIRSCIIENGIFPAFTVTVSSGNTRGASVNTVFNSLCTFGDPKFVDAVDYKLQFETQGYPANSPMVARSPEFYNTQGKRRDVGAWSAYETNIRFTYDRTFNFLKPAEKNAVQHIKHNRSDLHVSIDGTPDVATDPAGRWEELTLNYRALPNTDFSDAVRNHIAFVDYLESLDNPACEIAFDPEFVPVASVIVNGVQPAGTIVLALQPSTIAGGDLLTIGGASYMVLYVVGNSVVLSQPLAVGVADLLAVPVASPVGAGVFQYVAPAERRLSRWYEGATDFFKGLQMRFVRKWVGA